MKITNDEKKGLIRLISSEGLSDEVKAKIAKRLEKKEETLKSMKADMLSGKFNDIIAQL